MKHEPIAILGDGVTAKSVHAFARRNNIAVVDYRQASLIIASPGIHPRMFPHTTTPIISDIEWAYRLFQKSETPPFLIGVTGTNGKSTVTSLISHMCDIPYAGNIGVPLISYVGLEQEFSSIVVELSSYQLETTVDFRPDVAVLLNLTADHMSRHETMDEYFAQKKKCIQNQVNSDTVIFNSEDSYIVDMVSDSKAKKVDISSTLEKLDVPSIKQLPGKHNRYNIAAAFSVADCLGISTGHMYQYIETYKPLRHRIEWIDTVPGLSVYNDSKATNPESTIAALDTFDSPLWLICCGENKGLDLSVLAEKIVDRTQGVIVFGDISNVLSKEILKISDHSVSCVSDLDEAVSVALDSMSQGDTLIFSPSSSSLDCYKNFEERGDAFIASVARHVETLLV